MEYFRSGLKSVLGGQQPESQPTGAETVSHSYISKNKPETYSNLKL